MAIVGGGLRHCVFCALKGSSELIGFVAPVAGVAPTFWLVLIRLESKDDSG